MCVLMLHLIYIILYLSTIFETPAASVSPSSSLSRLTQRDINHQTSAPTNLLLLNNLQDGPRQFIDENNEIIKERPEQHQAEPMADVIAIKEGADLDLSCPIVVQSEDMIISWMCDNEPANIKSSRIHVIDSGKLRIKSAKVGDSCNYRCEAADGFQTLSVVIKVIIVDKRLMEQLASQQQQQQHPSSSTHLASLSTSYDQSNEPFSTTTHSKQNNPTSATTTASHQQPMNGAGSTLSSRKLSSSSSQTTSVPLGYASSLSPASSYNQGQQQQSNGLVDDQVRSNAIVPVVVQPNQLLQPLKQQSTSAQTHPHPNNNSPHQSTGTMMPTGGQNVNSNQELQNGAKLVNANQPQSDSLEVIIEPASLHVAKNRSFTLECRVKYEPHLKAPQILWLKEFNGKKPDSFVEQLEQNLILIDDIYYYTLNWPRSITYSHLFATANSALLIRHSNYIHSGRYICFAGYPPSLMRPSDLTMNSTRSIDIVAAGKYHNPFDNKSEDDLSPLDEEESQTRQRYANKHRSLKYKMAQAVVLVDDPKGEAEFKARVLVSKAEPQDSSFALLVSSFNNSSWIKNLAAILLITCLILLIIKLIVDRKQVYLKTLWMRKDKKKDSKQIDPMGATTETSILSNSASNRDVPKKSTQIYASALHNHENLTGDRLSNSDKQAPLLPASNRLIYNSDNKPISPVNTSVVSTSIMGNGQDETATGNKYNQIAQSWMAKLNSPTRLVAQLNNPKILNNVESDADSNNDKESHLYSEIGFPKDDRQATGSLESISLTMTSPETEGYYKTPKRSPRPTEDVDGIAAKLARKS